jgi:hypothetical protein
MQQNKNTGRWKGLKKGLKFFQYPVKEPLVLLFGPILKSTLGYTSYYERVKGS